MAQPLPTLSAEQVGSALGKYILMCLVEGGVVRRELVVPFHSPQQRGNAAGLRGVTGCILKEKCSGFRL